MKTYEYTIQRRFVTETPSNYQVILNRPESVAEYIKNHIPTFYQSDQEHFYVFILDTKNRVKGFSKITTGLLDRAHAHPREVFKPAVIQSASKIIIAHNHPSGELTVSSQDIECTKNIIEAGKILGIHCVDSMIVTEDRGIFNYVSIRKLGLTNF